MEVEQQNVSPSQTKEWRREYQKNYYIKNRDKCLKIATNCYNRKSEDKKKELSLKKREYTLNNKVRCEICDRSYQNIKCHNATQKHKDAEASINNNMGD